jgi:dihydroflavonol-4-reductase
MRAFVTRSTGLLGNNLVRTLMQAGHEVWALARSKEKRGESLAIPQFASSYFREHPNVGGHCDAVQATNLRGTMELARAAQAMGVRKMIHTSAA